MKTLPKILIVLAVLAVGLHLFFSSSLGDKFLETLGIVDENSNSAAHRHASNIHKSIAALSSEYESRGISVQGFNTDTVIMVKWEVKSGTYYGISPRTDKDKEYSEADWDNAAPLSSLLLVGIEYEDFCEDFLGDTKPSTKPENVRIVNLD